MTQRNPMNERYNSEGQGKTRKSAASAKPKTALSGTVYNTPKKKTKQETKAERKARDEQNRKRMERGGIYTGDGVFEKTPEYKRLRTIWGILLGLAIALVVVAYWSTQTDDFSWAYVPALVVGYILIIAAFYVDLGKIRKARKRYMAEHVYDNSKESRAAQKKARAEARALEKEAKEKYDAAQAEAAEKPGLLARFRKSDQ